MNIMIHTTYDIPPSIENVLVLFPILYRIQEEFLQPGLRYDFRLMLAGESLLDLGDQLHGDLLHSIFAAALLVQLLQLPIFAVHIGEEVKLQV